MSRRLARSGGACGCRPSDGTGWDVSDTEANRAAFGRPGNGRGTKRSAFVQVRMAVLAEVGSHAVLDAELAGCRRVQVTRVGRLSRSCAAGQLVLADREFLGVPLWRAFTATGADLLWRVPANRVLPVRKLLRDGSWLSDIHAGTDRAKHVPVQVPVITYQLKDVGGAAAAVDHRLVTTLLDDRFQGVAALSGPLRSGPWVRGLRGRSFYGRFGGSGTSGRARAGLGDGTRGVYVDCEKHRRQRSPYGL
ncbi:hypothetical protein GCM10009540_20560 [Streptomyces turgidiscabies]